MTYGSAETSKIPKGNRFFRRSSNPVENSVTFKDRNVFTLLLEAPKRPNSRLLRVSPAEYDAPLRLNRTLNQTTADGSGLSAKFYSSTILNMGTLLFG